MGRIGQRWEEREGDGDGGRTRRRRGETERTGVGRRGGEEEERGEVRGERREKRREEVGRRRISVGGMVEVEGCQNSEETREKKELSFAAASSIAGSLFVRSTVGEVVRAALPLSFTLAQTFTSIMEHGWVCTARESLLLHLLPAR
jgi:hypothetical protein